MSGDAQMLILLGRLRESLVIGDYWSAEELATKLRDRIAAGETFPMVRQRGGKLVQPPSVYKLTIPIDPDLPSELARLVTRLNWLLPEKPEAKKPKVKPLVGPFRETDY